MQPCPGFDDHTSVFLVPLHWPLPGPQHLLLPTESPRWALGHLKGARSSASALLTGTYFLGSRSVDSAPNSESPFPSSAPKPPHHQASPCAPGVSTFTCRQVNTSLNTLCLPKLMLWSSPVGTWLSTQLTGPKHRIVADCSSSLIFYI